MCFDGYFPGKLILSHDLAVVVFGSTAKEKLPISKIMLPTD
jgi:hypothetical protein